MELTGTGVALGLADQEREESVVLPIRRLVVAVDEKELSANVWREACTLAGLLKAEVVPVHVTMDDVETHSALAARIDDRLERRPDLATTGVRLRQLGFSVATALLDAAEDFEADMLVLGAGSKSTLQRVFLGSTAEAVSRRASVPVWVVRPSVAPRELKTVLCAVDRTPAAREALRWAVTLARAAEARLVTLAVVSDAPHQGADPVLVMELELREFLKDLDQRDVDLWVEVVKSDDPISEILERARSTGCDLLVLGQAGRAGLQRFRKSNTAEALVRSLPCSLLTTRGTRKMQALSP